MQTLMRIFFSVWRSFLVKVMLLVLDWDQCVVCTVFASSVPVQEIYKSNDGFYLNVLKY